MPRACSLLIACLFIACSSGGAGRERDLAMPADGLSGPAGDAGDGGGGSDGPVGRDSGGGGDLGSAPDLLTAPDLAWSGRLTITVLADNFCKISSVPASIAVPAGTSFKVTWVNAAASSYNIDIDKIDMFNQVPLIIGLEPGMSWTDSVRDWCGIFTGTFSFRVRTGCDTYYIPVNCNK